MSDRPSSPLNSFAWVASDTRSRFLLPLPPIPPDDTQTTAYLLRKGGSTRWLKPSVGCVYHRQPRSSRRHEQPSLPEHSCQCTVSTSPESCWHRRQSSHPCQEAGQRRYCAKRSGCISLSLSRDRSCQSTHEFHSIQAVLGTKDDLCLRSIGDLLTCSGDLVGSVSGQ